jgi:hypothetical protein
MTVEQRVESPHWDEGRHVKRILPGESLTTDLTIIRPNPLREGWVYETRAQATVSCREDDSGGDILIKNLKTGTEEKYEIPQGQFEFQRINHRNSPHLFIMVWEHQPRS